MLSLSINTHQTSDLRISTRQKKPFLHLPTDLVHVYQLCRNISYAIPPSHQSPNKKEDTHCMQTVQMQAVH